MPMDFAASIGDEIDGRPLHLYRLSECRFDELEIGLRSGLGRSRDGETAAAFVLWAAEHYRRNFAGGSFSWAFLTDELGLSLDQATLRDLTARGLRKLHRPPPRSSDAGVQYLRTLAEGGLPVRLLANEGGYRAALVGLVADLERFGAACPEEQALAFAQRRAERLPMGYRTEEFHGLFVQFARELVDLRGRAPRDLAAADVESWLDRAEPAWRERLTLRFDGDAARALFAEAMTVRAGGEVDEPLGRQLVRDEDGAWRAFVDVAPATRLDVRYDCIARSIALHRFEATGGDNKVLAQGLTAAEIRRITHWPKALAQPAMTDFEELLEELVDLGILSRFPDKRYGLRSAQMAQMLGRQEELEDALLRCSVPASGGSG